jgi:hypothetical protein
MIENAANSRMVSMKISLVEMFRVADAVCESRRRIEVTTSLKKRRT